MSDKSFGDHANRNIVKNPLLSSAVTGLCLEELTHKAVLLPVTPALGHGSTSEQQASSQSHAKHVATISPAGDALSNISLSNAPTTKQNVLASKNVKLEENRNVQPQSKSSAKSDDDFDVNEYIARLQGTRYVSAPLHSNLKEDQNANLEATDENLEEINLNETAPLETQQSLTADIAQNFSQLPTVLPHVASAVFSSFSNMLNYRREQTPERPNVESEKRSSYEEVLFQRPPDVGVPLVGVEEPKAPKEVAPPPKEPPVGGTSNFRISSKKKYAQIPGLSSRDVTQAMAFPGPQTFPPLGPNMPPLGQNAPPSAHNVSAMGQSTAASDISVPRAGENMPPPSQNITSSQSNLSMSMVTTQSSLIMPPIMYNMPPMNQSKPPINENVSFSNQSMHTQHNMPPVYQNTSFLDQSKTLNENAAHAGHNIPLENSSQVPQPDLFCHNTFVQNNRSMAPHTHNAPPTEPSISYMSAQQIHAAGSNVSIFDPSKTQDANYRLSEDEIKLSNTKDTSAVQAQCNVVNPAPEKQINYFADQSQKDVPSVVSKEQNVTSTPAAIIPPPPMFSNIPRGTQSSAGKSILPPSVARRISANQPIIKPTLPTPSFADNIFVPAPVIDTFSKDQMNISSSVFVPPVSNTQVPASVPKTLDSPYPLDIAKNSSGESSSLNSQTLANRDISASILPPPPLSNEIKPSNTASSVTVFTPEAVPSTLEIAPPQLFSALQNVPPSLFNPENNYTSCIEPHPITQMPPMAAPEPPMPVMEPPKAPATGNFRMTKKRPQYYSGPIEGVGSISNNIKPVIAPIMPTTAPDANTFQGQLLTPQQPLQSDTEQYALPNIQQATVPFDISRPVEQTNPELLDIKRPQQPAYGTSFNITQPESQNYEHEYNTPFDVSRNSYDQYNEPKQQSKGFGIIGSLKSKLSAIDINKIQNTVTTFFDPAYNDTKVDEPKAQKSMSYPQQTHQVVNQQDQSNFDIFVTNCDQYQHNQNKPIGFDYAQDNQYYQTQNSYAQSQVQNQNMSSFSTSSYFTDPNYSTEQVYSINPLYDNAQPCYAAAPTDNPQSQMSEKFKKSCSVHENLETNTEEYSQIDQIHSQYGSDANVNIRNPNVSYIDSSVQPMATTYATHNLSEHRKEQERRTSEVSNMTYYNPNANENRQIWEPQKPQDKSSSFDQVPYDQPYKDDSSPKDQSQTQMFYNPDVYRNEVQQTITQKNIYEVDISEKPIEQKTTPNTQTDTDNGLKHFDYSCDSALNTTKYNLSNIHSTPMQENKDFFTNQNQFNQSAASFFDNTYNSPKQVKDYGTMATLPVFEVNSTVGQSVDSMDKDTVENKSEVTTYKNENTNKLPDIENHENTMFPNNHHVENIALSLSKQNCPLLGVSSVPLFGLSEIISEKSKEVSETETTAESQNISISQCKEKYEEKSSNLVESVSGDDKIISEIQAITSPLDIASLSINDVKNVLVIEPPHENIETILKRNASSNKLENVPIEPFSGYLKKQIDDQPYNIHFTPTHHASGDSSKITESGLDDNTELNICETCREVNTPEDKNNHDKPEDLTTQLIENITSKLQLSNPLTVPLQDDTTTTLPKAPQYHTQLDEITQVAEETFETLQVQSATELLDESVMTQTSSEIRDYGWVTQEVVNSESTPKGHKYAENLESDTIMTSHTYDFNIDTLSESNHDVKYDFKLDPNRIGLFDNSSLFSDNMPIPKNASDEIKAEMKHSHEDIVLPRQMSIPTAPPEEDLKLDDSGVIDVLSIEQDAKEDFPLDEEFVIEPTTDEFLTTDDDKIEFRERKRSSDDSSSNDTFTNRVERFKKKVDNNDDNEPEKTPYVSPPISIASYFDTGNYAVESHYRNSILSMKIPPGFEEVYARKLSGMFQSSTTPEPYIPETTTQTKTNSTCTFTSVDKARDNTVGAEVRIKENIETHGLNFEEFKDSSNETIQNIDVSEHSNIIQPVSLFTDSKLQSEIFSAFSKSKEDKSVPGNESSKDDESHEKSKQTPFLSKPEYVHSDQKSTAHEQHLPDPLHFFSMNAAETTPIEPAAEESFSRLASYFSMSPPQPEHSKSFFELSQSQNHYRHEPKHQHLNINPYFHTSNQNQHIDDDTKNNIKELMKDLTSPKNIETTVVRTINYFSVELDNEIKRTNHAKPIQINDIENLVAKKNIDVNKNAEIKSNFKDCSNSKDNNNMLEVNDSEDINKCKYCSRYMNVPGINSKHFVVKSAVNGNTEAKSEDSKMSKHSEISDGKRSINFAPDYDVEKQADDSVVVVNEHRGEPVYTPVKHHWFYRVDVEDKSVWRGFSNVDSAALEEAYHRPDLNENTLVATDGGRYDVNIVGRLRIAVYWKEKPTNVRRCSWFYKGTTDARYVPYTELVAEKLEEEYRHGVTTGEWHRKLVLANNEMVIMHGPSVMVHFLHSGATDAFSTPPTILGKRLYRNPLKIKVNRDLRARVDHLILVVHGAGEYNKTVKSNQTTSRPRVVRRSHEESEIEESEPSKIDHLLLLCHGVGSACDMRFRTVEEVVEDFRTTSLQLLQSHYRNSYDNGIVSRVEVLPVSWHEQLHSGETGVDKRLSCVTLDSIPRLRAFTNHTVLDVLFYTSPVYHQTIIDTVCFELNRIYNLFRQRNPQFTGEVSLGGHSLGSVILYDLLCNQVPEPSSESNQASAQKVYVSDKAEAGQLSSNYPQLEFPPAALYALGSPIAIFECIRGVQCLGRDFALPTCKNFFNIFHPYDPIAYRIEPLIDPQLQEVKPSQIPHHKGRKRMHLELKDTMARVGADLKQKLLESLRSTWNKWRTSPPTDGQLEKVVEEEMEKEQLVEDTEPVNEVQATPEMLGRLNCGRRVDYVLQEAPLEMINEYLFAMSSHVGYWESEDTMLLMLREIYAALGVQPDCTVPQQSMTVHRTKTLQDDGVESSDVPSTSRGST